MPLWHFAGGAASDGGGRGFAGPGGSAFFLEAGPVGLSVAALRESLSAFLSVPVPIGSHLRLVQPVQSGAGALGGGQMRLLYGLSEGLPGGAFAERDFTFSRMHPLREVRGGLPGEMPSFSENQLKKFACSYMLNKRMVGIYFVPVPKEIKNKFTERKRG